MTCGATLKITETPILIGFQWDSSLVFATGTIAAPTYIDLSLYDIEFAIAPSATSTLSIVPTITKLTNGLATFRYTAAQTLAMIAGEYIGHCFLKTITTSEVSFFINLQICVIDPVPTP
jgi:hypothetical protein